MNFLQTKMLKLPTLGSFTVNFPNTQAFIEMESLKSALTSGQYSVMAQQTTLFAQNALDFVDAISFFRAVKPEIFKNNDLDPFNMPIDKSKELSTCYKSEIAPWIVEILEYLKEEVKDVTLT